MTDQGSSTCVEPLESARSVSLMLSNAVRMQLVSSLCGSRSLTDARVHLELYGYSLGARVTDRLILDKSRCHIQKDVFKFVCRELWQLFFQKQADRLQTNKKGGYIIFEENCPWLRGLMIHQASASGGPVLPSLVSCNSAQLSDDEAAELLAEKDKNVTTKYRNSADSHAALICGIIRGALTVLGCPCVVSYELKDAPSCSFYALVLNW